MSERRANTKGRPPSYKCDCAPHSLLLLCFSHMLIPNPVMGPTCSVALQQTSNSGMLKVTKEECLHGMHAQLLLQCLVQAQPGLELKPQRLGLKDHPTCRKEGVGYRWMQTCVSVRVRMFVFVGLCASAPLCLSLSTCLSLSL